MNSNKGSDLRAPVKPAGKPKVSDQQRLAQQIYDDDEVPNSISDSVEVKLNSKKNLKHLENQFDMSQQHHRFDDSREIGDGLAKKKRDGDLILGISIDSQSFDQSLINESAKRRRRKQKEDLDGSRLYREHPSMSIDDQPSEENQPV